MKIGNALIMLPYPTIALELSRGRKEFFTPSLRDAFKFLNFLKLSKIIYMIAKTIEIITLHVPDTLSKVTPYLSK